MHVIVYMQESKIFESNHLKFEQGAQLRGFAGLNYCFQNCKKCCTLTMLFFV